MNETPKNKAKPAGLGSKIKAYFEGLNKTVKFLSMLIPILVVLVSAGTWVWYKFNLTNDHRNRISQISVAEAGERLDLLKLCEEFDLKCLEPLLEACEKLETGNVARDEVISWITGLNNEAGEKKVFKKCMKSAKVFLNSKMDSDYVVQGLLFYIELIDKFQADHKAEVDQFFDDVEHAIKDHSMSDKSKVLIRLELEDKREL